MCQLKYYVFKVLEVTTKASNFMPFADLYFILLYNIQAKATDKTVQKLTEAKVGRTREFWFHSKRQGVIISMENETG